MTTTASWVDRSGDQRREWVAFQSDRRIAEHMRRQWWELQEGRG